MPYNVTTTFQQEAIKREQERIVECFILDLASVFGYAAFYSSTKTIVSRDRNGIFPSRILAGDSIEIVGSTLNDGNYTVASRADNTLTVSEALSDESNVEVALTNYQYYAKHEHNIYGYKMQDGSLINSEQIYTGGNIKREEIVTDLNSGKNLTMKVTFSNVDRVMEGLIQNRNYLRGCYLYHVTGFEPQFPDGTSYQYIGTSGDYNSFMLEKFYIDTVRTTNKFAELDCRYKLLFREINLPRRKIDINICEWAENYKGLECDPDNNIDGTTYPTCDGTLKSCRERGNSRRYGAFPGIPLQNVYV